MSSLLEVAWPQQNLQQRTEPDRGSEAGSTSMLQEGTTTALVGPPVPEKAP